jgi:hypothetical protein
VQPGFQFRGYRERLKRMRRILRDHGIHPHLTAHTTHTFMIPYHSFFDQITDGEDFYSNPPDQSDFIDHWPLDRMRFMHNGKWGLITAWLGWHGNSLRTDRWPAWTFRQQRAYEANMALHDLGGPQLRTEDASFVGYWDERPVARHGHEKLKVGAWTRPGLCRVMLVNVGKERIEAEVRLDPERMGFEGAAPDALAIRHADPKLLTYFEEDVTTQKAPKEMKVPGLGEKLTEDPEMPRLEERPEDLPLKQRRARDPDGEFSWKAGVLRCPVRPHDYRLFEFERAAQP